MKVKITMAFLALFMFAGTAGLATAQDTTKTTHKKTRTLTGCLPKGKAYDIERIGRIWTRRSGTYSREFTRAEKVQ